MLHDTDADADAGKDRLRHFVERVRATGEVWGLHSEGSWAFCESNEYEETDVIVFWSERAEAVRHIAGEWSSHEPTLVNLEKFVSNWLPGMEKDGALVGPNWDAHLNGVEIEPAEVAEALLR